MTAMNPAEIVAAMSIFKTGLDTIRSALGTLKDAKELLPGSKQKEELTEVLEQATDKIRAGEAALASALGYSLCRCSFPPVPRLLVGYLLVAHISGMNSSDRKMILERLTAPQVGGIFTGSVPVHECPKCKSTDAPGFESLVKRNPAQTL
jgi:hypothetical protein